MRDIVVAKQRSEDEHDRDVTLAWNVVRIWVETQNKKRMPKLSEQFVQKVKRVQSASEMKSMLQALTGSPGKPLKKRKKA